MMELDVYIDDMAHVVKSTCCDYVKEAFAMEIEWSPYMDLQQEDGYLACKIRFLNPQHDFLLGREFFSGCEVYPAVYCYEQEKQRRGLGEAAYLFAPPIDRIVAKCRHVLNISWNQGDTLEYRAALSLAAYLTDCCQGVTRDCQSGACFCHHVLPRFAKMVQNYEERILPADFHLLEFREWL